MINICHCDCNEYIKIMDKLVKRRSRGKCFNLISFLNIKLAQQI